MLAINLCRTPHGRPYVDQMVYSTTASGECIDIIGGFVVQSPPETTTMIGIGQYVWQSFARLTVVEISGIYQ